MKHVVLAGNTQPKQTAILVHQTPVCFLSYNIHPLLSLICDLHDLCAITQCHAGRVLLCADRTRLRLVLDEGNATSARYQANFSKSFESAKESCKGIDIVLLGKVLHEENLVWRQVFVWDDSCGTSIRRLETSTSGGLDWASVCVWNNTSSCRSLEALLLFCKLDGLLLVYTNELLVSDVHEIQSAYLSPPSVVSCGSRTLHRRLFALHWHRF